MKLLAAYSLPLQIRAVEERLAAPKLPLEVLHGDATDLLKLFPDEHFHACITDPPYGLLASYPSAMVHEIMLAWMEGRDFDFSGVRSLMRQDWDGGVPQPTLWKEVLRVLKPGAYLAVFASPRTADLTTMALRFAGAEIRDSIAWITTGGFPRSQSVGKMLGKRALRERVKSGETIRLQEQRRRYSGAGGRATPIPGHSLSAEEILALAPEARPALENFSGIRSGLRPAHEIIILARKPFAGSLLDNVQAHGTGGLNVSETRHRVLDGTTRYPSNVMSDLPEFERYYFAPKARRSERDQHLPAPLRNFHPAVKPIGLMKWLINLLTQPRMTVLYQVLVRATRRSLKAPEM
jgi:site-specific DNA-methyltransferase (adenine-specific)